MNYIKRHWKGELSLATSFWVNGFLLNLVLVGVEVFLSSKSTPIEHPVIASRIGLLYAALMILVIYPWQIVGIWRSAIRQVDSGGRAFLPRLVQVLVVLGLFSTMGKISQLWPTYVDLWTISFNDPYSDYQVHWKEDESLIHIDGPIGFGLSDAVEDSIKTHPSVKGIVLDSIGGRLYEGRILAELIGRHNLDTYTLRQCYSACTIAYIAGAKRYLAEGANLGFHQYSNSIRGSEMYLDEVEEERIDRAYFESRGVSKSFLDQMHDAAAGDLWYPPLYQLLSSGVVHEIVPPSSILKGTLQLPQGALSGGFDDFPLMLTIKQYEPDLYQQMMSELEARLEKGVTMLELQQDVGAYFLNMASTALPTTSDEAIVQFIAEMIGVLRLLNQEEPIACLKYIFPAEFGPLEITNILSVNQMTPMLNSLNGVLEDSYVKPVVSFDEERANILLDAVYMDMGDRLEALDLSSLKNREDYSKSCNVVIDLYQSVLDLGEHDAPLAARYLMSQ